MNRAPPYASMLAQHQLAPLHVCEDEDDCRASPTGLWPPRLGARARAVLRLHRPSRSTEKTYLPWMIRYYEFHACRSPGELGASGITQFLSHLATHRRVAASTQNQALAALLFLYRHVLGVDLPELKDLVRAARPRRLPVVLSRGEAQQVLDQISGVPRLMAGLLYGSGLRLIECCRLRVKDIDLNRRQILVRQAKGARDRATLLPETLADSLRAQIESVCELHRQDLS